MLKPTLSLVFLPLMLLAAVAQDAPKSVDADDIEWTDAPASLPRGAEMAVISGDPTKKGPFVIRLKLPEDYKVPPHRHPTAEYITVLSGRFSIGIGDTLDTDKGERLSRGDFVEIPADTNHYVWSGRGAIIQIHGQGPLAIKYANSADEPGSRRMSERLNEVIEQLNDAAKRLKEPQAKALYQTAADVLGALATAFRRYEKKSDDDD
jgi:quercetin dioxygenase-like cupin family protein